MAWNWGARWVAFHPALVDGLAASQARISELLSPNTPCLGNKMRCVPLSTEPLLPPRGAAVSALSPLGAQGATHPCPVCPGGPAGAPRPSLPQQAPGEGRGPGQGRDA